MNSFIRSVITGFTGVLSVVMIPVIGMSQEPFPPDSVCAEILGPDSSMFVSWQAPDSSGLVLEAYNIYRMSDFDPEGDPASGEQTWFLSHNWPSCLDSDWSELNPGWYAYGVEAVYTNGMVSEMAVSNIVGHNMFCSLNLTVSLETGEPAGRIHAELIGDDYSYEKYFGKDSAIVHFDSVLRGHYQVGAYHTGFDTGFLQNVLIYNDTIINILLEQRKRPVYDLEVDSVSLVATWSPPALVVVYEDFENEPFPPAGWQVLTPDEYEGWFRIINSSSGEFPVPPHDGYYALATGMYGTGPHNGCCDYLVTPPLDLTEIDDYSLEFDSFYNGLYGQLAFVEYSFDRGETWEVMYQLSPAQNWTSLSIDIQGFSGQNSECPLWLAFHADDNGEWASGWAVDNVRIYAPGSHVEFSDFNVFLDDSLVTNTTGTTWSFVSLNYGQQYTASVSVNYPYGTSKRDYYPFTSRYLPPPQDFTAQDYEEDVVLQWYPPDDSLNRSSHENEAIPDNLLGYNLYKNDSLLTYVAHSSSNEVQLFIDADILPGYYQYEVSGIYDLQTYGFPGDTGESMRIGTEMVSVDYCTDLDFHEDWNWGNFVANQWQTEGAEWQINNDFGNPHPSACFIPDTTLENYSSSLTSYPLCADEMSEGRIWLDFDLNLISNNNTGHEKLKIEVWNRVMNSWKTVRVYSNLTGDISWSREHINIRSYAIGEIFRVRFMAEGLNSGDIMSWCIDNIDIYRACEEPDSLWLEVGPDESYIKLNWTSPEPYQIDTMIFWGDGEYSNNSIGTGEAVEFDVAQRWEPWQLFGYDGASVTEIAFYPMELSCYYDIRIWTGPGAENLMLSFPYNPVIGQWNVVTLDQPFLIDAEQELWIGYHVNTVTGHPAGVDHGPAINGYGNMMNWGGWQTLLDINPELNYNWCIKAHVRTIYNKNMVLSPNGIINPGPDPSRDVLGYNVYRKLGLDGEYELIGFIAEEPCIYTDLINELYCFKVTAIWIGGNDHCESDYSNEACALISVGVKDPDEGNPEISLYPNPAKDDIMISSSEIMKQIIVYNLTGDKICNAIIDDNTYCLQTACFPNGLYLVKIITNKMIHSCKIAINH